MTSQKNAEPSVKSGDQISSKHTRIVDPVEPIQLGQIADFAKTMMIPF